MRHIMVPENVTACVDTIEKERLSSIQPEAACLLRVYCWSPGRNKSPVTAAPSLLRRWIHERTFLKEDGANVKILRLKSKADAAECEHYKHGYITVRLRDERTNTNHTLSYTRSTELFHCFSANQHNSSFHLKVVCPFPWITSIHRGGLPDSAHPHRLFPILSRSAVCGSTAALLLLLLRPAVIVCHSERVQGVVDGGAVTPAPGSRHRVVQHSLNGAHRESIWGRIQGNMEQNMMSAR